MDDISEPAKRYEIRQRFPDHDFIEFKIHPKNPNVLVCIEKFVANPDNKNHYFQPFESNRQEDSKRGSVAASQPEVPAGAGLLAAASERSNKSILKRQDSESVAGGESKGGRQANQRYELASLCQLSDKPAEKQGDHREMKIEEEDGEVKIDQGEEGSGSAYTLSYWDLAQGIPVQFKEVTLPFEEDVLILSFTESMRPYLLTRRKDPHQNNERNHLPGEYTVTIFEDGLDLDDNLNKDELQKISSTVIRTLSFEELEYTQNKNLFLHRNPRKLRPYNREMDMYDPFDVQIVWNDTCIFYNWDNCKNQQMAFQKVGESPEKAIKITEKSDQEFKDGKNLFHIFPKGKNQVFYSFHQKLKSKRSLEVWESKLENKKVNRSKKCEVKGIEKGRELVEVSETKGCSQLIALVRFQDNQDKIYIINPANWEQVRDLDLEQTKITLQSNQRWVSKVGGFRQNATQPYEPFFIKGDNSYKTWKSASNEQIPRIRQMTILKDIFITKSEVIEVMKAKGDQSIQISKYPLDDEKPQNPQTNDLREYSNFQFKQPFLVYCKGNKEIMIHFLLEKNKTMIFNIPQNEFFYGFSDARDDETNEHFFCQEVIKKEIQKEVYRRDLETNRKVQFLADTIDNCKKVFFTFLTKTKEKVFVNKLVLIPYASRKFEDQFCLHFKSSEAFKDTGLIRKWPVRSFISQVRFPNYAHKQETLFIQYTDMLQVSSLKSPNSILKTKQGDNVSSLNFIETGITQNPGFLYVTDDKIGSSLKVLMFVENKKEYQSTLLSFQGSKVRAIAKRFNKVYILDDMWTVSEYGISELKNLKEKTQIEIRLLRKLEFSPFDKTYLEENQHQIFSSFLPTSVTNKAGLKLGQQVFKLFDDTIKTYQEQHAVELDQVSKDMQRKDNKLEEEKVLKVINENMGLDCELQFLIKETQSTKSGSQKYILTQAFPDSDLNCILTGSVKFFTFIKTERICEERILLLIDHQLLLITPTGNIVQRIDMIEQISSKLKALETEHLYYLENLQIEKVSLNAQYFTFNFKYEFEEEIQGGQQEESKSVNQSMVMENIDSHRNLNVSLLSQGNSLSPSKKKSKHRNRVSASVESYKFLRKMKIKDSALDYLSFQNLVFKMNYQDDQVRFLPHKLYRFYDEEEDISEFEISQKISEYKKVENYGTCMRRFQSKIKDFKEKRVVELLNKQNPQDTIFDYSLTSEGKIVSFVYYQKKQRGYIFVDFSQVLAYGLQDQIASLSKYIPQRVKICVNDKWIVFTAFQDRIREKEEIFLDNNYSYTTEQDLDEETQTMHTTLMHQDSHNQDFELNSEQINIPVYALFVEDWDKQDSEGSAIKLGLDFLEIEEQGQEVVHQDLKWRLLDIYAVNADNRVQLLLENLYDKEDGQVTRQVLLTWNLAKDMEDRHYENHRNNMIIQRGVNSALNYASYQNQVMSSRFVDLEFNFNLIDFLPQIVGYKEQRFLKIRKPSSNQLVVGKGKDLWVHQRGPLLLVQRGLNQQDAERLDNLKYLLKHDPEYLVKKGFPITNIFFRDCRGSNIFHILIDKLRLLQKFQEKMEKIVEQFEDEGIQKYWNQVYLLILYPNSKGKSVLDLAMNLSSQYVECLLEMLSLIGEYQISRHMFQDLRMFQKLVQLDLPIFKEFLGACKFTPFSLKQIVSRKWPYGEADTCQFQISHSIVSDSLLEQQLGPLSTRELEEIRQKRLKMNRIQNKSSNGNLDSVKLSQSMKGMKRTLKIGEEKENLGYSSFKNPMASIKIKIPSMYEELDEKLLMLDLMDKEQAKEKKREALQDYFRLKMECIEFDWIFEGESAKVFVDQLATSKNPNIFDVDTVKVAIDFLWDRYFWILFWKLFLPFTVFLLVFITYSSFYFNSTSEGNQALANYLFAIACIFMGLLSLRCPVVILIGIKREFLLSPTGFQLIIDIASSILVITFSFYDVLKKEDRNDGRRLGAIAVFFMWLKLFYLLRIFGATSSFIRMIIEAVKGMSTFLGILFISILAFANIFYIIDGGYNRNENIEVSRASGDTFFLTFAGTYQMGLGEWDTDGYGDSEHEGLLWFYFIFCTFIVQIVLFNLLIAIMEDTFDRVAEKKEQTLYQEACQLISENWLLLGKDNFKKAKYIVLATKEKAIDAQGGNWEGRVSSIKHFFKSQGAELAQELRQITRESRVDLKALESKINSQVSFLQSQMLQNDMSEEFHNQKLGLKMQEMIQGKNSVQNLLKKSQK